MSWSLMGFYLFFLLIFYLILFYACFSYVLMLLVIEGVASVIFFFISFINESFLLSLELMFLVMGLMVFEGVIGLCLLIYAYRVSGLNYYNMW